MAGEHHIDTALGIAFIEAFLLIFCSIEFFPIRILPFEILGPPDLFDLNIRLLGPEFG
jgi:hypothetical protein